MSEFPLSLKELRLALGLTQEQMANALQTTRGTLSMAEAGLRPIGAPALFRVQKINQLLMAAKDQTPAFSSADHIIVSKTEDWLDRLKVEHHRLKKQLAKLKSSRTQSVQLGVLLSRMGVLLSPDFNPQKDNFWKEMIEAAQAEPEEKVWEIL